jgi:hypothetical protein
MTDRFPNISGIIEEVLDGYTVTIFLRTSPGIDGAKLLADQPAGTIDEARGIIEMVARERSIPEDDVIVDIRMFDIGPPPGRAN